MTKYIQDTLEALDLKIAMLQRTRTNLEQAFKDWTIEVDAPSPPIAPRKPAKIRQHSAKPARQVTVRVPKLASNGNGRIHDETLQIAKAVRALKEPFNCSDVMRAAGLEYKKASNFLTQSKVKGWIVRSDYGSYTRTPTFGQSASSQNQDTFNEVHRELEAAKPKDE